MLFCEPVLLLNVPFAFDLTLVRLLLLCCDLLCSLCWQMTSFCSRPTALSLRFLMMFS